MHVESMVMWTLIAVAGLCWLLLLVFGWALCRAARNADEAGALSVARPPLGDRPAASPAQHGAVGGRTGRFRTG